MSKVNTKTKTFVLVAMLKGFIHATVMPILIMILTNYFTADNWGLFSALIYIAIVSFIYAVSENKDISRDMFFDTLTFMFVLLMIFSVMVMS